MTGHFRAAFLLVAVLALVAGTGCGSDTKSSNDYVDALNKVQNDFANSVSSSTAAPSSGSSEEKAQAVFTRLDAAIGKLIDDLKKVTPPDKVKSLHSQLVREMTQFKAQVKKAGDALRSGDPQKIVKAQTRFATDASALGNKIGDTIQGINDELHS
jgi:histidinol-phosphate/aromatic aminotransferase/cobyric acid decarboxylase-like protein